MKTTATLVTLFTLFSFSTSAADYTRWELPEGAKARLGKGNLSGGIAYSPDGTRLAVGGSIGVWLYDTATFQVKTPLIRSESSKSGSERSGCPAHQTYGVGYKYSIQSRWKHCRSRKSRWQDPPVGYSHENPYP